MDRRTEDLRVLRTHTLLLRALSDLLQEKPFDEIRVKEPLSAGHGPPLHLLCPL